MSNKINVILVDDHEMVRLGLKSFLNLQGDVEVVGEAGNGREVSILPWNCVRMSSLWTLLCLNWMVFKRLWNC